MWQLFSWEFWKFLRKLFSKDSSPNFTFILSICVFKRNSKILFSQKSSENQGGYMLIIQSINMVTISKTSMCNFSHEFFQPIMVDSKNRQNHQVNLAFWYMEIKIPLQFSEQLAVIRWERYRHSCLIKRISNPWKHWKELRYFLRIDIFGGWLL